MSGSRFARRLLAWHARAGRRDLPWQHPRTPYRVWLSEVMLQQTQVATVIPYFERFVAALPDLPSLARAEPDRVLALWSGLGYYSRARNLHRAAQLCVERHGGALPDTVEALAALPGIGRSTAAAILAQAHGQRHAILDGNAKRVLARHAGVDGDPSRTAVARRLWAEAEARLPHRRLADYTQAMMDLGATLCVRRRPRCSECPVAADCVARATGRTEQLPGRKPRRTAPVRATAMLVLTDASGRVLLERRPPSGIWGGLWSLPECAAADAGATARRIAGSAPRAFRALPGIRHAFTHFTLEIAPLAARVTPRAGWIADAARWRWQSPAALDGIGLPQPVRRVLATLAEEAR